MTYKVELARQAEKALDRLDRVTEKRLRDRLKELSLHPYDPRLSNDVIMEENKKYSRVGDWRVIFRVKAPDRIIFVTAIQHRSKAEFQSVQCLWLRASLKLSADQVAIAIGWHPNSVRKLQARYFKEGEAALKRGGKGGRYYQNLTLEEERQLLQEFLAQSERGGILEVSRVKAAYEQTLGRKVPKSTVYRMLARHGWRKIVPRPRHPKSDAATQAACKKNWRE